MAILNNAFCRVYQKTFKMVMPVFNWDEPELLKRPGAIKDLPALVKSKGISNVLVVTDKDGKVTRELGRTKTQKSVRPVPLYKQAKLILKEQQEKHPNATLDDLVFVNEDGGFIDRHKVNRTLKAMAKRGALSNQDVGSHVIRHTFGAYLVTQGVDIYKVSQYLGHSSIRMTEKVYAKLLASKNDMVAINVFDNLFGEE